ncbi:MAG: DUF72 domain-containing protein [Verrucomicrobiota bacterium]
MIWIGTSGFQYPEWKGSFYPEKMPATKMLTFYGQRFATTEINYTFRRLPSDKSISNWLAQTPERFRFTLKALQRITDFQRLQNCEELTGELLAAAMKLGEKRGALLFQLPPSFKCDLPVLRDFLALLPRSVSAAFEFRHKSWFCDATYETLRDHNVTLCIAESEKLATPTVFTGSAGYLRLRCADYTNTRLRQWANIIEEQKSRLADIYIYFKHEEAGTGPRFAKELSAMLDLNGG